MLSALKQRPQWVLYGADKQPKQISGWLAASDNPRTWASYADVKAFATAHPELQLGVGYVITPDDNLTCIDLDTYKATSQATKDLHKQIRESFPTYSEKSPSGNGTHIWCYGKAGTRKYTADCFEVYDSNHYMTVTEDANWQIPIADCTTLLQSLIAHFDARHGRVPPPTQAPDTPEIVEVKTDQEILTACAQSSIGDKFKLLWEGNFVDYFAQYHPDAKDKSQSEADLALCNFLSFYTDSKSQLARLFRISALGKRAKAKRNDYVVGLTRKAFDLKQQGALISPNVLALTRQVQVLEAAPPEELTPQTQWLSPPGMLGEIANYIYESSIKQSPEIAISAAIGLLAGMCGRQFNTYTHTGLNQYIVLLASSAHGKEGAARGISRLATAASHQCMHFDEFIGPAEIASAPGLLKHIQSHQSFISKRGEFGLWLQRINHKYAKGNELHIKGLLLDLFHKSGMHDVLQGSAYSDVAKNMPTVIAPAVTILGDSTPEEFYKAIDEANIAEGMVSRLTVISANDDMRPIHNEYGATVMPDAGMVARIALLGNYILQRKANQNLVTIVGETPEANEYQNAYLKRNDDYRWNNRHNIVASIRSRTHIRLLRLAALAAVSRDYAKPIAELSDYVWAEQIVEHGVDCLMDKFNKGEIGERSLQNDQYKLAYEWCKKYQANGMKPSEAKTARLTDSMILARVFKLQSIQTTLKNLAAYRLDRNGPAFALQNVLKQLISSGVIIQLNKDSILSFNARGDMYQVVE